jgi:tRNA modification GTPase
MNKFPDEYDTIVAVSTPRGYSGIGVIRMSGPSALDILTRIFKVSSAGFSYRHRVAAHGHLIDPDAGKALDDGVAVFFKGPASYTGDDLVELSLHGNPLILDTAVRLAIRNGARLAAKGEFTRRAFLAGKLDLLQAEAVIDLIESKSLAAAQDARSRLDKSLSSEIILLSDSIKDLLATLEAYMDFDEDEEESEPDPHFQLTEIARKIEGLKRTVESGRMRMKGIRVVISGKPNVGKSTLFNALVRSDRAIVTPHPGTTRDIVDHHIVLDGIAFLLSDTAGLRENPDPIEQEGILRSRASIAEADLVLAVIDGSLPPDEQDRTVLALSEAKRSVIVFNKTDLGLIHELMEGMGSTSRTIPLSAKTGEGIDTLEKQLVDVGRQLVETGEHGGLSSRCLQPLESAEDHIENVLKSLRSGESMPPEIISLELRKALSYLEELTGERIDEGILDRIFDRFCIGK